MKLRPSVKLLITYLTCVVVSVLLSNVLPEALALFLLTLFIAGSPFFLFVIGIQALSEMK